MTRAWRALALVVCCLSVGVVPIRAQDREARASYTLPLPVPDRPFMLTQAGRRFAPDEIASVDVEHRGQAHVTVEIHRVLDPEALLSTLVRAESIALSTGALGIEMERLVRATGPLPRVGSFLSFVGSRTVDLTARAARTRVTHEQQAYDSYETDESGVETSGVWAGDWTERNVELGALPAGLYVARATDAAWASATLVSVGTLTLIVRRGDDHDEVRVLDPEGTPLPGIVVRARVGAQTLATGITDAIGRVVFPASTEASVRFVASRGDDITWADASHAPMSACDVRVYLGIGRPVFRLGERVHLRGHVRGCDATGHEGPLANEPVTLEGVATEEAVRTDANGDFVTEIAAVSTLGVSVRGHGSSRDIQIDSRRLPDHTLVVRPDRAAVASGEPFTVQVSDEAGEWPTRGMVTLTLGDRVQRLAVGPGLPAVFSWTAPTTDAVLDRLSMRAVLEASGQLVFASAETWTGARRDVIELDVDRATASPHDRVVLRARARDLEGAPRAGLPVTLEILASDGNRATSSRPLASAIVTSSEAGIAETELELTGPGPWWARAHAGLAASGLVVRNRSAPPPLSDRDDVSLQLATDTIAPGQSLEVQAFGRGGGAVWITLEQGSVWASELVHLVDERARVSFSVPERARGLATVVVSQIHRGGVRSASRTIEVRTSEPITLEVEPASLGAVASQPLHVTLRARDALGAPADAVVSVWMANAGYWDLGDERYPAPNEIFRLPGRPASGADGSAPVAFGAEEGRQLASHLTWNGVPMPRASFRHAWGFGGSLVTFDVSGSMSRVVASLARAAGLRAGSFCRESEDAIGTVVLSSAELPWDLVAMRVAERVSLEVGVEEGVLTYFCPGASGMGSGAGGLGGRSTSAPLIRSGAASMGIDERELLEGDLFFEGRIVLGPDGVAELDIPMPAHPGRFRIEALAIRADGGGDRAHAIVHATGAVSLRVELPSHLVVSDRARGAIEVSAPSAAGREAELRVTLPGGIAIDGALPSTVTLDEHGHARVPFGVTALSEGARLVRAEASVGALTDRVVLAVDVLAPVTDRAVAYRALVGPSATDVTISLPRRAEATTLHVRIDADAEHAIESALSELSTPRWGWLPLRLDRLEALVALRRAAARIDRTHARELARSVAGGIAELVTLMTGDASGDPGLTASLVIATGNDDDVWPGVDDARAALRARATDPELAPMVMSRIALALAPTDAGVSEALLARARPTDIDDASIALRAAHAIGNAGLVARFDRIVVREIVRERASLAAGTSCRGPVWYACFARRGSRARLARAAEARVVTERPHAIEAAAEIAQAITMAPTDQSELVWGRADADVIALVSSLAVQGGAAHGELFVGEHASAHVGADGWVSIPEGDAPVTLRLAADADRLAFVRVDGSVMVRSEDLPPGDIGLSRRVGAAASGTTFELSITTRERESDVTLVAPLPAGLELALASGQPVTMRSSVARAFSWAPADPRPEPRAPEISVDADGVHLHFRELERGVTQITLPVAQVAQGHFTAAPATIVTASGSFGSSPTMSFDL